MKISFSGAGLLKSDLGLELVVGRRVMAMRSIGLAPWRNGSRMVTAWRLIDRGKIYNALPSRSSVPIVHDWIIRCRVVVRIMETSLYLFDFGLRVGACLPFRSPHIP